MTRLTSVCAVAALVAGCLAKPTPERVLLLGEPLMHKGTVPVAAGMLTLRDARPADHQIESRGIESFADAVTYSILSDFSEARLFSSLVHVRDPGEAPVVLRGEIRSFEWRARYSPWPYIPGLGGLAALGVPVATSTAALEVVLDVVDPRPPQPIGSYTGGARDTRRDVVYRYQEFRTGNELDRERDVVRRVADELQTAILADRDKIVTAAKSGR
jgi:hypothetical protein